MAALSQAWRALVRRPAFTLVTILTLAASAGITAAVFSVVDGVVWKRLPYPDAGELVAVYEANPGQAQRVSLIAPARLEDWQRLNRTFVALAGSYSESVTDTSGAEPERLQGRRVTPGFFEVFRATPLAGRTFVADEERYGGPTAAVIGEELWNRRFARRADAIGSRLIAAGVGYTIVGIMPRSFAVAGIDVWIPSQLSPNLSGARAARFLTGVGRMRAGVSVAEARDDLSRVQRRLGDEFPETDAGWSADVRDLKDQRVGEYRRPLVFVLASVVLLFAIATANVAGLVLVQLQRRTTEFAVRAALGASRLRIAAAVLHEVLLLGALAAVGAVLFASWLAAAAGRAMTTLPRASELGMDWRSAVFVLVSILAAAMVFGALPAMTILRPTLTPLLAAGGRTVAGGRHRLQHAIVVAQLALGVLVAGSAGLLVRSYNAMASVDMGFDPDRVLTFHVGAAWDEDRARVAQLQERLLGELVRIPGVRDAGFANFLPATGATLRYQVRVDGYASGESNGAFNVGERSVSRGYLRALKFPLAAGSWCEETKPDFNVNRVRDAMVNRAFVDRVARGGVVVGRQLSLLQGGDRFRIVGVIGDALEDGPSAPPYPYLYACVAEGAWPDPEYVVRAEGDARATAAAIRQIVRALDPARPVFGMKMVEVVIDEALDQPRMNAAALSLFAAAAVVLAGLGLYGLMTLVVGERRREIGVRLALGASPHEVVWLVAGGAIRLVGFGVAIGAALTLASAPMVRALLFGVGPFDPYALALAAAALALAALAAVAIPIRQALAVSAVDAMRLE
ncbi:MAG TPA: ADOP family duplicated permease [Vicinamibacterales bacterium]